MKRRNFLAAVVGILCAPFVSKSLLYGSQNSSNVWPADGWDNPDRLMVKDWDPLDYTFTVERWIPCNFDPQCECETRLARGEQIVTCKAITEKRLERWELLSGE